MGYGAVMSRPVTSRHVPSRHATPRLKTPRHASPRLVSSRHVTSREIINVRGNTLETLQWESLEDRRKAVRLCLLLKVAVHKQALITSRRQTRKMHPKSVQVPSCKADYRTLEQ